MNMKQTNSNTRIIKLLVAIAILGGLTWFLVSGQKATAPDTTDNTSGTNTQSNTDGNNSTSGQTPATNTPAGNNIVVVSTQTAGTKTVTVDNVNLSKPGFIVIKILQPGPDTSNDIILGASKILSAGSKQDLEIPVNTKLNSTVEYTAHIYLDDGDKKFDINKDTFVEGPVVTGPKTYSNFTAK